MYHESCEHEFAKEMLGADYSGGIHCDGYEAYHKFDSATVYGCMPHVRRRFVEALDVSPHHKKTKHIGQKQPKEYCEENVRKSKSQNLTSFSCALRNVKQNIQKNQRQE